jgi:FAD:protein FMN transferase
VLPGHAAHAALARGHADDIELDAGRARLRRPVLITLDGIAKGFAVDLALSAMRRAGAASGWVNAGGDVGVYGDTVLPMQRRELDGSLTALGGLRNAAMASSRAGAPDPAFPGQIVAPAGHAAARGVWTVVARSAWRADALTKVAATAPAQGRTALIGALGGALLPSSLETCQ